MTVFLRSDGLAGYRTVVTYLALLAGVFSFLSGFSYLTTVLACLGIGLGWANLRAGIQQHGQNRCADHHGDVVVCRTGPVQ